MGKPHASVEAEKKTMMEKEEPSLKGTLVSVLFVGFVIAAIWFGVFALYISRL